MPGKPVAPQPKQAGMPGQLLYKKSVCGTSKNALKTGSNTIAPSRQREQKGGQTETRQHPGLQALHSATRGKPECRTGSWGCDTREPPLIGLCHLRHSPLQRNGSPAIGAPQRDGVGTCNGTSPQTQTLYSELARGGPHCLCLPALSPRILLIKYIGGQTQRVISTNQTPRKIRAEQAKLVGKPVLYARNASSAAMGQPAPGPKPKGKRTWR